MEGLTEKEERSAGIRVQWVVKNKHVVGTWRNLEKVVFKRWRNWEAELEGLTERGEKSVGIRVQWVVKNEHVVGTWRK